jgi:hypothetical protein
MKQFFINNKWSIAIIIILLIAVATLFFQKQSLKYSLIEYQSVPRIGLTNTLSYSSADSSFHGSVTGFVAFNNIKDQPHDLTQYYIIEPLNRLDKNSNQIFSLDEIIAMNVLAPASIGKSELNVKSNSSSTLTLEDENGNQFFIDKITREVSMRDAGGDETKLITNDLKYRDFMWKFLNK